MPGSDRASFFVLLAVSAGKCLPDATLPPILPPAPAVAVPTHPTHGPRQREANVRRLSHLLPASCRTQGALEPPFERFVRTYLLEVKNNSYICDVLPWEKDIIDESVFAFILEEKSANFN